MTAQKPNRLPQTASQTAGPYVHIGLAPSVAGFEAYRSELGWNIAGPDVTGERVRVQGTVTDGAGALVKDVLIEVWQADAMGNFADKPLKDDAGFRGWGRAVSDFDTGHWSFETIKPGASAGPDGSLQAPHISLWIVARGINFGLQTRLYFEDEVDANARDPVLNAVTPNERRNTLIAQRRTSDTGVVYRFDIRLQGENETVFFDF